MISDRESKRLFRMILKPWVLVITFNGLMALTSLKTWRNLNALPATTSKIEQTTMKKSRTFQYDFK